MKHLRQSTAATLVIGPFVDATDGDTEMTGLTIASSDIKLWKHGGTSISAKNDATGATHRANGYYTFPLDATDTGTAGNLEAISHPATALPCKVVCVVLPAVVYDSIYGAAAGSRVLRSETAAAGASGSITLDSGASTMVDFYKGCLVVITGGTGVGQCRAITAYSSGRVATVGTNWVTNPDNTSTFAIVADDKQTAATAVAAVQASVNTIDDFLDTEIAAIKAKTDNLPAAPAAVGDIPSAAANATAVLSAATAAPIAADVQQINAVPVVGDGSVGNEFEV